MASMLVPQTVKKDLVFYRLCSSKMESRTACCHWVVSIHPDGTWPPVQWNFDTPCLKEAEQPPMILSKVPQVQSEAPYETISSQAPARSRECLHPRWLFVASWDGEFAHRLACFSACRHVRPVRRSWSIVFGSCTVLTPVPGSLWSGWLLLPARLFLKLIRWQPRE